MKVMPRRIAAIALPYLQTECTSRIHSQEGAFAIQNAFERVVDAAGHFGIQTSYACSPDVVWADVTGCAHLYGPGGEVSLAEHLGARVRSIEHACRVAIASGPRIARAIAWYSPLPVHGTKWAPIVVETDQVAAIMGALPIEALMFSDESKHWLKTIGVRTVQQLRQLPRASLAVRLGGEASSLFALLDGDDRTPLVSAKRPNIPDVHIEFEDGIEAVEALLFVVKGLSDRMMVQLADRAMSSKRLELELKLDRSFSPSKRSEKLTVALPSALRSAVDIMRVLHSRIEAFTVTAPIVAVHLRATELVPHEDRTRHLFAPESKAERALPCLVAELVAEFGEGSVGTLSLRHSWQPDERTQLLPFGVSHPAAPLRGLLESSVPEPARLLPNPLRVTLPEIVRILARHEAVEWWKSKPTRQHWVTAWMHEIGAVAFAEIDDSTGESRIRGWMD